MDCTYVSKFRFEPIDLDECKRLVTNSLITLDITNSFFSIAPLRFYSRFQELKVYQLQKFVPSHPDRFDDEVLEYQQHLERTYRLCRYCKLAKFGTI